MADENQTITESADLRERLVTLEETQRAILNVLEDMNEERTRLNETQIALTNILEDERIFAAKNHSLPVHVYMGVGKEEGYMVSDMEDLARTLRQLNYTGLDLQTEVFDQEEHGSVIPFMMSRGLRAVYTARDWK